MNTININAKPRALVIGGSLGGLFAGNMLRRIGWDVDIYERSNKNLDSRGGGIVLQPEVTQLFHQTGLDIESINLGVSSYHRTVFNPDGSIQSKQLAPQTQTSWSLIYTSMKRQFGDEHYHHGKTLLSIEQDHHSKKVIANFNDGTSETGDLLIGADGNGSTVRRLLWPNSEPSYAGYLAWRGLIDETAMPTTARKDLHG
ncbi:FAD-dependent monooxygenase, partial [bacterium]|nr:FAD-dependent monooxygenase [bacterium]